MPRLGMSCCRGKMSDEECRACIAAHNGVTPCHIPAPFLEMMRGNDGEPSHDSFTPSRLLGCFRQPVLMETEDFYTNVEHAWASVRGTLIHSGIEQVPYPDEKHVIREARLSTTVNTAYGPQKFSGKADCIIVHYLGDDGIEIDVWDWKTREFKSGEQIAADRNHQAQVWMYAWLAVQTVGHWWDDVVPIKVRSANIAYISSSGCRIFTSLEQPVANVTRGRGANRHKEEMPLEAIRTQDLDKVGRLIRSLIEAKIRARTELPDMLEGDAAAYCFRCPVYGACRVRGNVAKEQVAA